MSNSDDQMTAIRKIPLTQRCAMLALSIIERNNDAIVAVLGLIGLANAMSQHLGNENRIRLANAMRDAADCIENNRHDFVPMQ
jgi:hypothetical protein